MYHSITFGSKNTWEDWHLVPTSRPLFLPPKQKRSITDIPGGDGVLDMSEALTGYPVFNNREGSFEFIVMNGYWEWYEAYSTVMEDIHGKTLNAYLEDDTDYYYEGQFEVDQWKSDKNYSAITINYSVAPYKIRIVDALKSMTFTTNQTFRLRDDFYGKAPECPVFDLNITGGDSITVRFVNRTLGIDISKELVNGKNQVPEFIFYGDCCDISIGLGNVSCADITIGCKYRRF